MRRVVLGLSGVAVALLVSGDRAPSRPARVAPAGALQRRLKDVIAAREYEATESAQGLQAPNRANGLRTYFDSSGVRVLDRSAPDAPELARLTLAGVGRGAALARVTPGEVIHDRARVEIRRAGLTEWYENKPEGLEQGFKIQTRPDGKAAFALELAISGGRVSLSGDALFLRSSTGRRLRYGDLHAEDARGRALPAHLELLADKLVRLVVDDSSATYPIAIDPLLTAIADTVLAGTNDPNNAFGTTVAAAGDVNGDGYGDLIVGAPQYDPGTGHKVGAAFVFLGSAAGIASGGPSSAQGQLLGDQYQSRFGLFVASAGDVNGDGYSDVIVGAPTYNLTGDPNHAGAGAIFIYHGGPLGVQSGDPTTAATELRVASAGAASAGDVNGDGYSDVIVHTGHALIFLGSPSGIAAGDETTAATRIQATSSPTSCCVSQVASAGDVNGDGYDDVIVGGYDSTVSAPARAFIFLGSASGIPDATFAAAATQLIGDSGSGSLDSSVASAGDVNGDGYGDVIVGALNYTGAFTQEGAALVYLGGPSGVPSGTAATASATLTSAQASGAQFSAYFGWSVGAAGDVNGDGYGDVVVGSLGYTDGQSGEGAAFVFLGSATGVASGTPANALAKLESNQAWPGPPYLGTQFGISVTGADVNGDGYSDVAVGAPYLNQATAMNVGAVFVYLGAAAGISNGSSSAANRRIDSTQLGAQLGASVASAGDVNGDGYSDVIVGAPFYDAGESDEGAAFIFQGGAAGIAAADPNGAATTLQSDQPGAQFGASVASAGDVNGDGYSDVIVGAPFFDSPEIDEGAAFVFLGSATGVSATPPATAYARFESDQVGAELGASVASAGDVNGDGRADVIVGAPFHSSGQAQEGAAFVFVAGPTGFASGSTIQSDTVNARLGTSVASAGDVNGDGYADVIIGAPRYPNGGPSNPGIAVIFRGSATGIASGNLSNASTTLDPVGVSAQLGASVSGAGDVNGDGFDDVIVGAPKYNAHGAAFIFAGSATPPSTIPIDSATSRLESSGSSAAFGSSVASAGDVNGDGFSDLIVGGPASPGQSSAWLFSGGLSLHPIEFSNATAARLDGDVDSFFGVSVASAGDVNGDGFADLVIGASLENSPSQQGSAFLFYGGGHNGRAVLSRQRRGDGSGTLVQAWGDALHGDGFVAQITGTHPSGRGRVKAQAQACPAGVVFGGVGCVSATSAAWSSVTPAAPSAPMSLTLSGLLPNKLIHWRARVLRADATEAAHPVPEHGPWRRLQAQTANADIRTSPDADLDSIADSVDNCRYRTNPGQEDAGGFGSASPPDGIGDVCQCGNVVGTGRVDAVDVLAYRQSLASGVPFAGAAATLCRVYSGGTQCNILQLSVLRRGLNVPALAPLTTSSAAQVCPAALP